MKQTLLLLFGGTSNEYPVSLQSAAAVLDAIDRCQYEVLTVGITRQGQWLLCPDDTRAIREDSWYTAAGCRPALLSPSREDQGMWLLDAESPEKRTIDLVFPVLHGRYGEDGTLQGLLELAGLPFVGCGSLSSALCMDKAISHDLAAAAGFTCPRFTTLYTKGQPAETLAGQTVKQMAGVPLPWFVKPACEGSSFGISRVNSLDELPLALHTASRYGDKLVVEEGIGGFEVGCAVLGNQTLTVGNVDAIRLAGGFFDYHEKYNLETARILLPAPLSPEKTNEVQQTARRLYRLFGCWGFARVDMFVTEKGQVVFNEINTIPGLTSHSRYPGMLADIGIGFEELIQTLLELAVKP